MEPSRKPPSAGLPPVLREAVAAHEAGLLETAEPLYRQYLADQRENATALQLLGLLYSQRGEYPKAIPLMTESLRLLPGQPEVANNLGNALAAAGMLQEAVDRYADALRLNPSYGDAYRNLGLCYLQLDLAGDARVCFERCVALRPDDAAAWLGLGNACKRQNDLPRAISCFEKALELRPDYAEAHHNLGVCLRMTRRAAEAKVHYETARGLGLDRAELYHNLASAQVDALELEAAVQSYREAIRRNPLDRISHRNLNKLLWEQDWQEDYLASYRDALHGTPDAVLLRLDYADALTRQGEHETAERVLMEGLRRAPDSNALKHQLAFAFEGQGRAADALQMHAAAAVGEALPVHIVSYARALLAADRPDEALRQAEKAIARTPLDQRAIAYMGLCWRMLGNERDALLNDYESFVRVYDVPIPDTWRDAEEFNADLNAALLPLHVGKRHPPEQTLRGGTQTHGNLFDHRLPEIDGLVAGLSHCIRDYIRTLPEHRSHPLLSRRRPDFDFSASWSVRLARCGFHTMHVHPLGWISSAYYVQVPPEITRAEGRGGWLKFGEPDIDLGDKGAARRHVEPQVGRLVLFPSYMWHGTVPFDEGEARTTVAFDVVPKADR